MNGEGSSIRQQLASSCNALIKFFEFVTQKGFTVADVFSDSVLGERTRRATAVFDILSNFLNNIVKKDNHASPQLDKLILEASCVYEWTLRLFLHIFSKITPYREIENVKLFIQKIGDFLRQIQKSDVDLFDYFIREIKDLVTLLTMFFDTDRLNVKLNLTHFSSKRLALVTVKIRATEEYFEPNLEFDFSVENIEQVESLYICAVEILISIGKPFVASLGIKSTCEMMSHLVTNCISFASPKMLAASLKLFHRFYPVKCIKLDPSTGFFYQTCWLTVALFKSPTNSADLYFLVEKNWDLITKRLDLELEQEDNSVDVSKALNSIIVVMESFHKMTPLASTKLVNESIAVVLHKLLDLCKKNQWTFPLPEDTVLSLQRLYCDKLAYTVSHDSVWIALMKRVFARNYTEIYSSLNLSFDGISNSVVSIENNANRSFHSLSKTFFEDFCRTNSKVISQFMNAKSLDDVALLHNMYAVERETISSLRLDGHCLSNQGNFMKMMEVVNWICDFTLANTYDENKFKFVLSTLITTVKAIRDFDPNNVADFEQKIGFVFMIPHVAETSPLDILAHINSEWTKKHLFTNDEINILSLYGLAVANLQVTKFVSNILHAQICRWNGDDYTFNQTLTFILLKNDQLVNLFFQSIEDKENMSFIAKSIGLITCFLSSAEKGTSFSFKEPYELCDSVFHCAGCADWDNSNQKSSLPEDAECKLMELFHEIVDTKDPALLNSLGKWSASRVLRHCGIDRSLLVSIFKLFSIDSKEVSEVLTHVFFPLIMKPIKSGSVKVPKKELLFRAFNKVFGTVRNHPEKENSIEITEINNITILSTYFDESDLHHVLIVFFRKVWSNSSLKDHIREQMLFIARSRGLELRSLFIRYKSTICNKLINIVLDEIVQTDPLRGWFCLREALMLFADSQDETALNPLFTNSLLYFFCAMVQKANDHAHALLQNFFKHSDLTASFLTSEYGYGLPRQFVAQSSLEAVEKSLKFVKKINEYEALERIFRNDFHNSMLIEYHRNPRVAAYVVYKIYISEACSIDQEKFQDTKFIIMLEAQMGPFIIALNRFLLKSGDVLEDKRLAVESLGDFLNLLGPRKVPAFKMNIMGILLTAFNQAKGEVAFLKTLLKIWNQFLNSCGPNDIGPHLSVICKDLAPYFEVDPQATAKIFKRMIVENENNFKERFRELHFLPKVAYMEEVHAVLSKYLKTKSLKDPSEARDYLKENIRYFDQLFNINNPDVKALHVKKLTTILSEFKKALAHLCLPNKEASTDIIIAKIIRKLLLSSQISDTNLLISIAECLGEIGAIDPGRLDLSLLSAHQISDGGFIEFTDLPVTLLSKLANTLDSIDQSRIRDCLCYSIQEILKSYTVRENDDIWSRLSTDVQRNIKRFFTTKYIFKEERGIVNSPVFNAEISYDDWLNKWSIVLIERIERFSHKRAFEACIAIIRYNSTIARFLLPTIFWMALLDSNEATIKTYIIGEINSIIEITSMDDPFEEATLMQVPSSSSPRNDTTQNRSEFIKTRLKCARTFFAIIDGIAQLKSKMFPSARKLSPDEVEMKSKIELLENNLKKTELAELAFECQAYARALLYMEDYICKNNNALSEKLVYFQKYFLSLDEPDGVEGINAIREGPTSLIDMILYHEANSELNYSLSGCEIAIKKEPDNLMYPKTLLRCLMNLDQHATAFNYATGLIQRKKQWTDAIYPYMVEASWKLHNWDDLERMLHENESLEFDSLGVNIGHLIDCIHSKDETNFKKMLREIRKREMDPLSISSSEQGAYIRCYQHILRLHMLTDIEKFAEFVFKHNGRQADNQTQNDFFNLIHDWIRRNNLVQSSLRCQEQVFNLQRVLLSLHSVLPVQTDLERAQFSLASAKLARKSLNLQRAYTHLVESTDLINSGNLPISLAMHSSIETAKFHWAKGDQESKEHCIKELKRELEKYEAMSDLQTVDRVKLSKLKLLFTKFSEKLSNLNSDSLNMLYRTIIRILNESKATGEVEEPYFCLARFSDRLMKEMEPKNPDRPKLMVTVAKHYCQALKYGSKHVYESMPRLLSIWCDLGSSATEFCKTKCAKILENNYTESCKELTDVIEKWKESISPHLFFTAFSQLLSRICHGNQRISEILMQILAKLVKKYPDQSMWMLIGVLMNRKNKARADKCAEIIKKATSSDEKLVKLVRDMKQFALLLIKLCNCEAQGKVFHVKNAVPELNHALKTKLGPIMLPYQAFMNVRMKNKFESSTTFRPFPSDPVYIQTFDDLGEILPSQARPKKVVINCSDGKKYSVMCKPKDDLRKDARTMELNNLINRLLKRDPETRKRGLHIRTYTVVPLDNDCGLIEWVKNLQCLRESIYISKAFRYPDQVYPTSAEAFTIITREMTKNATNEEIVKRFNVLLQKHSPPVLGEWFIQTFPDPTSWYMARLAFTRSAAVMSIVGYIIGLGDRHTENFLIDSSNGEAMHVDFNLIFNQGDLLEVPEKVPFRLTHNMVAAMGVTGYEGAFRKTCEVTLRLMREKKEALMSVLQPFVYDPLCEWKKSNPRARTSTARSGSLSESELVEATNTKALEYVGKIEDRLNGAIKKNAIPISVSGQVRYLIEEATNVANLGRMFIGWSAYL